MLIFRSFARRRLPPKPLVRDPEDSDDLESSMEYQGIMKDISEMLLEKEKQGLNSEDALADLFGKETVNKISKAYEDCDGKELNSKDLSFAIPKELEDIAEKYFNPNISIDLPSKPRIISDKSAIPNDIQNVIST